MLGIVFSAIREAKTGLTVSEQAQQLNVPMFILLGSIAYASLVPIMKGAKTEAFGERRVRRCLGWDMMPCGCALANRACAHQHQHAERLQPHSACRHFHSQSRGHKQQSSNDW